MASTIPPDAAAASPTSTADRRRAVASSFLGQTVEYYDFLLYGAAAGLVFPKLFFTGLNPGLALLLSYLTLFTGYVARPLGGLLFGHFGDKYGRKKMLIITLMMMGIVSFVVGLMPTAATIGVAAPILLAVLRVIQGFAVGGEWAGAMLMSMEHTAEGKRGLGASIAMAGAPFGAVMATLVLGLFAGLPDEQFLAWGWRLPFLFSVVVVILGLFLRRRVSESPDFEAARERGDVHTGLPIATLFTKYPREVILGSFAAAAPLFVQGLLAVFMVPFVVSQGAMDRGTALMWLTLSNFVHIFTIPFFAWLSDRFGRKQVMIAGAALAIVLIWPMFGMFNSGNATLVGLAFLVGNPLIQAAMFGPLGAFLSELFDTGSRYSGVSASYQLGSLLGAGLAPIVGTALVNPSGGIPPAQGLAHLAWFIMGAYVIAALAVFFSRTHKSRQQTHPERFTEAHRFEG